MKEATKRSVLKGIFITLILIIAFCLTGCSSVKALVKSSFSGLPIWVYNPQFGVDSSRVSFVGQGRAETERQAELLAYSDIISQLSSYLGVSLGQEQYRELSVLGTINEFQLTVYDISNSYVEGQIEVYVRVVADSALLIEASSEETIRRNETAEKVESLVLQGDEYIKGGQDLKGVSSYLQSMILSYEQDYILEEYSYNTICEEVKDILSSISITLISQDKENATCTVQVTRKSVLVSSRVKTADIKASYEAIDVTGALYSDAFIYSTDDMGNVAFSSLNFTMVREGSVLFSLDLDDELNALESSTNVNIARELKCLVDSKTVSFDYDRKYSLGTIAVAVVEHDLMGYITGNKNTADYIVLCLTSDGATAQAYYALSDQEADILYDYVQTRGSCDCLLVCRFGQTNTIESSNGIFVTVEGTGILYSTDLSKGIQTLYESGIIYASGSGETQENATSQAYLKLADIIYSLLKAVYV